jgi:hypothetical protein
MREAFENWLLVFSIIVVLGIITFFSLTNRKSDGEEVLGTQRVEYKYAPYITSIPPISVGVGEDFEYRIEVSDLDTPDDQIAVYLNEKPVWMYIEENTLRGVPTASGTYKYVVTVSDGANSTSQVNYILVEENE